MNIFTKIDQTPEEPESKLVVVFFFKVTNIQAYKVCESCSFILMLFYPKLAKETNKQIYFFLLTCHKFYFEGLIFQLLTLKTFGVVSMAGLLSAIRGVMGLHSCLSQSLFKQLRCLRILQGKVSGLTWRRSHVIQIIVSSWANNAQTQVAGRVEKCIRHVQP